METCQIQEGAVYYYLTFTVIQWLPVFVAEEPCKIFTDSLNYCHHHKSLCINAFAIMPTHIHVMLFVADFDSDRLRNTVRDMRQFTGRQLADYSEKHLPAAFAQVMKGTGRSDRARQFWQQSKHAVAISTADFWQTKLGYIHENPVRKGLVREATEWRFSSAAFWLLDPPGETDVVLTEVEW